MLPENQIIDVHFAGLQTTPISTIRNIYKYLGIEFNEKYSQKMSSYLSKKPRQSISLGNEFI